MQDVDSSFRERWELSVRQFDTGAGVNVTILSVPEGDDKPLKYPLMYQVCDGKAVNKIDVKCILILT